MPSFAKALTALGACLGFLRSELQQARRQSWCAPSCPVGDVYDENLATGAHRALLASHGMPYGDFLRVVYPSPNTSTDYASFNLSSIASSPGTFVDE